MFLSPQLYPLLLHGLWPLLLGSQPHCHLCYTALLCSSLPHHLSLISAPAYLNIHCQLHCLFSEVLRILQLPLTPQEQLKLGVAAELAAVPQVH